VETARSKSLAIFLSGMLFFTRQGYGKLLQLYGVHKATIEARKRGLSVLRRQQQNGTIKLVLMGV